MLAEPRDPSPCELYEANLPLIDEIIAGVCRRRPLSPQEAEDFAQEVRLKLWEGDCEKMASFRGDSSLRTYLMVVINQIALDYMRHLWGRWRPSAKARRLGKSAEILERLTARDGFTFDEAERQLRQNDGVLESRQELLALWEQLPEKIPRRFEEADGLSDESGEQQVEESVVERERRELAERVARVVTEVMADLDAEDQLIFRLIFGRGWTVADTAKRLGLEQKGLYRRRDRILGRFRRGFDEAAISFERIRELFGWPELDLFGDERDDEEPEDEEPGDDDD